MKYFYFISLFFLLFSCSNRLSVNNLFEKRVPYPGYSAGSVEYISFHKDGIFETKNFRYRYFFRDSFYSYNSGNIPKKEVLFLNYRVDSTDEIGGLHCSILDERKNFLKRSYFLVDGPFLFDVGIKPKPLNENYFYDPGVFYVAQKNDKIPKIPEYHTMNLIFSDSLKDGEYFIYFNKRSGASSIKKENVNIEISHIGIIERNEFFDPRYYALRKFKGYIKKSNSEEEIPVIIASEQLYSLSYEEQKKYIEKLCPLPDSKCILINRLNPYRSYFADNFGNGLKGGNILPLQLITRDSLLYKIDRNYYGW